MTGTFSSCETHPMSGLNRSDQVQSFPDVNVPVEGPRVCDVIFSWCYTKNGLQVTRLPKNAPLWSESVSTQRPELQRERGDRSKWKLGMTGWTGWPHTYDLTVSYMCLCLLCVLCYLDVFDSTAHQAVLLKWVPADVEDLEDRRNIKAHIQFMQYMQAPTHTQSPCLSVRWL